MVNTQQASEKLKSAGFAYTPEEVANLAKLRVFAGAIKDARGMWQIPIEDVNILIKQKKRQRRLRIISIGTIATVVTVLCAAISGTRDGLDLILFIFNTATVSEENIPSPSPTLSDTATPTSMPIPTVTIAPKTPTPSGPIINEIIFGLSLDPVTHAPILPRNQFPIGITRIATQFTYHVQELTEISFAWYSVSERISDIQTTILRPESDFLSQEYSFEPDGLQEGTYELRIYIGNQPVQVGEIEVLWRATILPIVVSEDVNEDVNNFEPINPRQVFERGITSLYAVYDILNFQNGQEFSLIWYHNGNAISRADNVVNDEDGWGQFKSQLYRNDGSSLLDGQYEVRGYINGELEQITIFVIR